MNNPRPKAKLSRALGIPLTPKCVKYFETRPYPPGVHGRGRKKDSPYKAQLLEKQRLRAQYNIREAQLRLAFDRARKAEGKTGEALVVELERRLDALVLRAGFARTIYQARQFVVHRHRVVPVKAEVRHVQRDRRLLGAVGIEVRDHQDGVLTGAFAVRDDGVVVGVMEAQVPQLPERGMAAPDGVEALDEGRDAPSLAFGGLPVTGAQLVLLRVQVLLAALAQVEVLVELEAGVDAPRRRHHRGVRAA